MSKTSLPIGVDPVAGSIPFDNTTNGFSSDEVQAAIEEVANNAAESASPGFTWGKGGSAGPGEYLNNDEVESNKAGRLVPFDGFVAEIFVNNEQAGGSRSLQLMRRRPAQSGGFSVIQTVTLPGGTPFGTFFVTVPVLENDELAIRVAPGSNDFENPIVGVIVKNTSTGTGGSSFIQTLDDGILQEAQTFSFNYTGAGVTATSDGLGNVTVNIPGGGAGGGEANDGANIGNQEQVFAGKNGVNLEFRTIGGLNNIDVNTNGNILEVTDIDVDRNKSFSVVDTVGGQAIGGAFTNVPFNSTVVSSSIASFVTDTYTIAADGIYKVFYSYSIDNSAGSRSESLSRLILNGAPVAGSLARGYHRNAAQGAATPSKEVVLSLTAGDTLTVQGQLSSGAGSLSTIANEGVFSLTYLRSSN